MQLLVLEHDKKLIIRILGCAPLFYDINALDKHQLKKSLVFIYTGFVRTKTLHISRTEKTSNAQH